MQLLLPFSKAIAKLNGYVETKNEALARVDQNANEAWKERARRGIEYIAMTKPEFTADDLNDYLIRCPEKTHDKRAAGAIFKWAQSEKLCEPTSIHIPTRNRNSHCRPLRVWKSLVFKPFVPVHSR